MSDPRYRNGVRSNWHERNPELDTPTAHGWTRLGENSSGVAIFELGAAFMRAVTMEDKTRYDWLVFIGTEVYGYNGSLSEITADVRKALGMPEAYFLPDYVIPIEAFGGTK